MRPDDLLTLPDDLPVPEDDGASDHLAGMALPPVALPATDGGEVRLDTLPGRTVVFAYPRTGRPDEEPPGGTEAWNAIPGARGCSVQAQAFARSHARLRALGPAVYGLSTQSTDYQRELVERLDLPFTVLSDARLELARALRLPTFEAEGMTLLKRLTMVIVDGRIEHVFYPVFPPDRSADEVVAWLER
jgi:peroxiredoxin